MVVPAHAALKFLHDGSFLFAWSEEHPEGLYVFRAEHELVATKRTLHQEFWSA